MPKYKYGRCMICDQLFLPHAPNQKACPGRCSKELSRQRKRRSAQKHPRPSRAQPPLPERPCARCGVQFPPKRKNQKHCSKECRRLSNQKAPIPTEADIARARLEQQQCALPLQELLNQPGCLPRSIYADKLEAVGLPGNVAAAAKLRGIPESTLRMRLQRGTDLNRPLMRNRRCGRYVDVPLLSCPDKLPLLIRVAGVTSAIR